MDSTITLRALEREDLRYVHQLNNDNKVMSYGLKNHMNHLPSYKIYLKNIFITKGNVALF